MATLVLTALGGVVGGPVGAAVGSGIGQAIDRATLFKPATRSGPRLSDLAVQTSSYGSAIPKLFGTIRVAGIVIWATDLIENRARQGGGKGRAATDTYSYSASFAVLLSAREIVGVRRIWAEGNLIRGMNGDWKTTTGFRLRQGGEDQAVDPLIASAEGAMASAHRGCAYAVFEGMPLADYGNRIPSLTFEVIADAGPIDVGTIAAAVAPEVDGAATMPVDGFTATGNDVAAVLDSLAEIGGAWWRPAGDRLTMCDGGAAREIVDAGMQAFSNRAASGRRSRSIAPVESVARTVSVAHYDPARDYQLGVQQARRPGAGMRADRIELPAVLGAGVAKGIAMAMLARGDAERTRRTVHCGVEAIGVGPGDVVRIAGEAGDWRVRDATLEAMAVTLALTPRVGHAPVAPIVGASGRVSGAPDRIIGTTRLAVFESPLIADAPLTAPRLLVAASGGAGWRRADLSYSLDNGASWIAVGSTAAPAVMGRIETVPVAAGAALIDERSAVVVRLDRDDMVLEDADPDRIDRGANLAMLGDELIQFARAEPLGQGRWRLRTVRRGRRGTEAMIGTQAPGDRFVMIEPDAIRAIDLPGTAIGRSVLVMASGAGDVAEPVMMATMVSGGSVRPLAPVHLTAAVDGDVLAIGWTRRSRAGWAWVDGIDVPLGEETEAYRVTVTTDGGATTFDTIEPRLTVPRATVPSGRVRIAVRQRGTLGLSDETTIDIGEDQ